MNEKLKQLNQRHLDYFKEIKALKQVERWLSDNPPPGDWEAGRYSWAFTEMPIWFLVETGELDKIN